MVFPVFWYLMNISINFYHLKMIYWIDSWDVEMTLKIIRSRIQATLKKLRSFVNLLEIFLSFRSLEAKETFQFFQMPNPAEHKWFIVTTITIFSDLLYKFYLHSRVSIFFVCEFNYRGQWKILRNECMLFNGLESNKFLQNVGSV